MYLEAQIAPSVGIVYTFHLHVNSLYVQIKVQQSLCQCSRPTGNFKN